MDRELADIENSRVHGNTRRQYQGIKKIRNGYQPRLELIKDRNGDLLLNSRDVKSRWIEYFKDLLNRPAPDNPLSADGIGGEQLNEDIVSLPSQEEVLAAIKSLKNNKACGIDGY